MRPVRRDLATSTFAVFARAGMALAVTPFLISGLEQIGYAQYIVALAVIPLASLLEALVAPGVRRSYLAIGVSGKRRLQSLILGAASHFGINGAIIVGFFALFAAGGVQFILAPSSNLTLFRPNSSVSVVSIIAALGIGLCGVCLLFAEIEAASSGQLSRLRWMELGISFLLTILLVYSSRYFLRPEHALILTQTPTVIARAIFLARSYPRKRSWRRLLVLYSFWRRERGFSVGFFGNQAVLTMASSLQVTVVATLLDARGVAAYGLVQRIFGVMHTLMQASCSSLVSPLTLSWLKGERRSINRFLNLGVVGIAVFSISAAIVAPFLLPRVVSFLSRDVIFIQPFESVVFVLLLGATLFQSHVSFVLNCIGVASEQTIWQIIGAAFLACLLLGNLETLASLIGILAVGVFFLTALPLLILARRKIIRSR